jgi:transposase-like protein
METKARICPRCLSKERQMSNGKNKSGTQKVICGVCRETYTEKPKSRAYPKEVREQAVKLLLAGMSSRRVGQLLGFNKANAYNWCKDVKKTMRIVDK